MEPVYLDYAATTPVRTEVGEAMLPFFGGTFGNPSSAHRFGRAARAGLEQARRQVARAVDAEPTQVCFTSGGTEADNLAVVGAAFENVLIDSRTVPPVLTSSTFALSYTVVPVSPVRTS